MKKIVFFAMLLSSLATLKAQNEISFICNGNTYQNGDTVVVNLTNNHSTNAIIFRNNTSFVLQEMVATMTGIELNGITINALCAGECVPGLVTTPFNIDASSDYTGFMIDYDVDESVAQPYSIYTLQLANHQINSSIVVRLNAPAQGIDEVADIHPTAYPNPSNGRVTVSYNVSRPSTLAVYDMQGRMVRQISVNGNGNTVIDNLPVGIYTYGIMGCGSVQKLIVK